MTAVLEPQRFVNDPLASPSGQFALGKPSTAPMSQDTPSPVGVRPWGLRNLTEAIGSGATRPAYRYCHEQQVAVTPSGRPAMEIEMGKPTANTTSSVDGEDPPSSEDWNNDFAPEHPYQP